LHVRYEPCSVNRRGIVVIVHGVGEHLNRYHWLTETLTQHGYDCVLYDQRGHGRSAGSRIYVSNFTDFVDDLVQVHELATKRQNGTSLYVFGHSMGSIVVLLEVLRHPEHWDGVIVAGCPLIPLARLPPWLEPIGRLAAVLAPKARIRTGIKASDISHDPKVVQEYTQDVLVEQKITLQWGTKFLDALDEVNHHAAEITKPILLLHGEADRIADVKGSEQLFCKLSASDKTLKTYPGLFHELHNEPERDRLTVFIDILNWLTQH